MKSYTLTLILLLFLFSCNNTYLNEVEQHKSIIKDLGYSDPDYVGRGIYSCNGKNAFTAMYSCNDSLGNNAYGYFCKEEFITVDSPELYY